jgi:hypothetical protein
MNSIAKTFVALALATGAAAASAAPIGGELPTYPQGFAQPSTAMAAKAADITAPVVIRNNQLGVEPMISHGMRTRDEVRREAAQPHRIDSYANNA